MSAEHYRQATDTDTLLVVADRRVGDAVVVTAAGEVDMLTVPRLRDLLLSSVREPSAAVVVLDLIGVEFLGSFGLALLMQAAGEAEEFGKPLRVAVGKQHPVRRILEVAGLDRELPIYNTAEEACLLK